VASSTWAGGQGTHAGGQCAKVRAPARGGKKINLIIAVARAGGGGNKPRRWALKPDATKKEKRKGIMRARLMARLREGCTCTTSIRAVVAFIPGLGEFSIQEKGIFNTRYHYISSYIFIISLCIMCIIILYHLYHVPRRNMIYRYIHDTNA